MRFFEYNNDSWYSKTIGFEYFRPNGERRKVETRISNEQLINSSYTIVEAAKHNLERQVQNDILSCAQSETPTVGHSAYTQLYLDTVTVAANVDAVRDDVASRCHEYQIHAWVADTAEYQSLSENYQLGPKKINIKLKVGKRFLIIEKSLTEQKDVEITEDDILKAREKYYKETQFTILTKRAERKAEDLLRMLVSDIDFRNYKKNGYFTVKQNNRIFRVWRDNHKMIDTWEQNELGVFIPKNRLCTHTEKRELPLADEVITKLMLIKSNRVFDQANAHPIDYNMKECYEKDLILI